jgi:hypothetical protein
MSDNPYSDLPSYAFWKTAVSETDLKWINLRWQPKTAIDRKTKIITVGSCFAQHISKALKENGFCWIDSEPAPTELPVTEHTKHNYGVFSFRTGNIYTAGLLKQWILWAIGTEEQSREYFFDNGQFFDPFRPSLTVNGFSSLEKILIARQTTLSAIFNSILHADLFIFTLGLTEAWRNKDGRIYPICPGTVRGTFSPDDHHFHNFNEHEVRRDLAETFDALLKINPNLRFLLTVSPVPLTATASGQHVISATTYSKSVLRSAAGYLSQTRSDTDYFPSFELITAPAFKGLFYEKNMRVVSSEGVAFVMKQFLGAIDLKENAATPEAVLGVKAAESTGTENNESEKDICDDIILEAWSNKVLHCSAELPNILLIGDSHIGKIAAALDEQGIRYAGGGIMSSLDWFDGQFELRKDNYIFDATSPEANVRWDQVCTNYLAKLDFKAINSNICITNVGANTITPSVSGLLPQFLTAIFGKTPNKININLSLIWAYVQRSRVKHLMLVRKLVDLGFKVVWVTDPPIQVKNPELHGVIDLVLEELFTQTGCNVMNARKWVAELGVLPSSFQRPEMDIGVDRNFADFHHGTADYYQQLTKEILNRYSIEPQYRKGD